MIQNYIRYNSLNLPTPAGRRYRWRKKVIQISVNDRRLVWISKWFLYKSTMNVPFLREWPIFKQIIQTSFTVWHGMWPDMRSSIFIQNWKKIDSRFDSHNPPNHCRSAVSPKGNHYSDFSDRPAIIIIFRFGRSFDVARPSSGEERKTTTNRSKCTTINANVSLFMTGWWEFDIFAIVSFRVHSSRFLFEERRPSSHSFDQILNKNKSMPKQSTDTSFFVNMLCNGNIANETGSNRSTSLSFHQSYRRVFEFNFDWLEKLKRKKSIFSLAWKSNQFLPRFRRPKWNAQPRHRSAGPQTLQI